MPELPEVETMVRGLRPALAGRLLGTVKVHDPFLLEGTNCATFEHLASGRKVERIDRSGKWVLIILEADSGVIVIQPRMTGAFWLVPPDRPEHARLTFRLQGSDQVVWYCDARRLGKIRWHDTLGDARVACARSQGPDALEISRDDLAHRLKQTSRSIKPTLMDQKVLAGIGNIYADEILFASRLHPERVASQLKPAELDRLHAAVGEVLHRAVEAEGSSFDAHYRTVLGLEGGFLATNAMYGRAGRPCPHCGNPIVREHIRGLIGRSTYYCPRCQPPRVRRA